MPTRNGIGKAFIPLVPSVMHHDPHGLYRSLAYGPMQSKSLLHSLRRLQFLSKFPLSCVHCKLVIAAVTDSEGL
jgi:hypothetical protein